MSSGVSSERPGGEDSVLVLPGRFRAVVFDLDGLLLDTEPGWRRAESELLRRHGERYTAADAAASLGTPVDTVIARYASRLGLDADGSARLHDELMELARAEYGGRLTVRAGAAQVLTRLHGNVPLGLASNTPRELVDRALDGVGFRALFTAVVTGEDVGRPKPAPDIYLEACRALNVRPQDAVALEDSAPGMAAARSAGMTVIAVPESVNVDTAAAHHVVASLADLVVT